jgi:tRNA pseudouridine55 synthase
LQAGLVLVDKPQGWTSHDVVARIRRVANTRRVGHAGTLDPMATGLLVLGVESATKLLTFIVGADKTYEATIRLGASTITDDRESEFLEQATPDAVAKISTQEILDVIAELTGNIEQVPSSVSAIKVDGVRAYAKVRGGDEVKLKARPVTVSRFEVIGEPKRIEGFIDLDVIIDCSSGTYIRALARDLGAKLDIGGHLTALRRTRVGGYTIDQASKLPEAGDDLKVIPSVEAARVFTTLELSESQVIDLRHGKRITNEHALTGDISAIFGDQLIAILTPAGKQLKSQVVFND